MKIKSIIAVVPARLGSQRVKLKSLRLLNKKPLIEYILTTLKNTRHLKDIYINSDSELFEEIARSNNVKFYHRKKELATSESLIDEYLYDFMKKIPSDYLAVVNPTSPFICSDDLDKAVDFFFDNNFDTLLSAEKIQTHCFIKGNPINFSIEAKHPRSQDIEPILALNFAISIWNCNKFIESYEKNGFGVYSGKIGFFITEGRASIDIDYEEDFVLAEFVARFYESNLKYQVEYSDVAKHLIENNIEIQN